MKIYLLLLKHLSGQSVFRSITTIFAVTIATLIILIAVSLGQGWSARDQKTNLVINLFSANTNSSSDGIKNPVYLSTYDSTFNSQPIKEIGIYKTAQDDILPAGLTNVPSNNELWVTPKLKHLIDGNPLLAERYDEYDIKALFPSELASSPDILMLLYRIPDKAVSTKGGELQISSATRLWNSFNRQSEHDKEYAVLRVTIALLAGTIIITPILLLVAEIARIGMVQREKRYAALSLIGVTRAQLRLLTAIEILPLSFLGSILGVVTFILIGLPALTNTPIGGNMIWLTDLYLSSTVYLTVCAAIIISTAIAGLQSLSAIKISPLAVTRTQNDIKNPSFFSLLPLIIGTSGFIILSAFGQLWFKDNVEFGGYILAGLIATVILGIFIAGPYLTYKLASTLLLSSRSAAATIAAYRLRFVYLKDFRSISGIVLALFVGALLMTLLATVQTMGVKYQATQAGVPGSLNPLQSPLQVTVYLPEINDSKLLKTFENDIELRGLTSEHYVQKSFRENSDSEDSSMSLHVGNYYESCLSFKQKTGQNCGENIGVNMPFMVMLRPVNISPSTFSGYKLSFLPVDSTKGTIFDNSYVLIAKDLQSLNRVVNKTYNIASKYYRETGTAVVVDHSLTNDTGPIEAIKGLEGLIMVMLIIAMTTGGLSLIVNVIGSIFERKRTFVRLRIMGASIATLTKSLSIEILAPLCALSLLVVSLGILTCYYLLSIIGALNDGDIDFSLPSLTLWAGLCVAIVFSVLVFLFNIPLLAKLINFDEMRSE